MLDPVRYIGKDHTDVPIVNFYLFNRGRYIIPYTHDFKAPKTKTFRSLMLQNIQTNSLGMGPQAAH
jgi:hypothetical protein